VALCKQSICPFSGKLVAIVAQEMVAFLVFSGFTRLVAIVAALKLLHFVSFLARKFLELILKLRAEKTRNATILTLHQLRRA
jgi:hypothetical protein